MVGEERVKCQVCKNKFKRIQWTHLQKHDMTIEEYRKKYPEADLISEKERNRLSEAWKGENNPKEKKRIKIKCDKCGKEYEDIPSNIERSNHHFCSRDCSLSWQREQNESKWENNKIETECEYCGKIIKRHPQKLEKNEHHFCSYRCRNKALNDKKVEVICMYCNKTFKRAPSEVFEHNFCSNECRISYWKENPLHVPEPLSGKDHPNYGQVNYPNPYYVEELGHSVRSSWEEKIGILLKSNKFSYGYESKTFELSGNTYTPDFIIRKNVIEVKGFLKDCVRKKYQNFNEKFSELTFIMVGNGSENICDIHIPWGDREDLVDVLKCR